MIEKAFNYTKPAEEVFSFRGTPENMKTNKKSRETK
jgi:hypothetical protein